MAERTETPTIAVNLVDPELYRTGDPYAQWRLLREHDPVHWHAPAADLPGFWALTRYEDVRDTLRDAATFSSAHGILLRPAEHGADPGGGKTLALTDPPRHRKLRGLVDEWFALRSVRAIEDRMAEIARDLVVAAADQGSCDFVTDIAARVPLYMICGMMGVPRSDWEQMYALSSAAFGAGDPFDRQVAHLEILGYFEELCAAKTADPGDDLVSVLAAAEIDGRRLTPEEIILNCDNLFVGGSENTRIAASGGMLAFLEHPEQWQALREDPALLPTAVEEVLRWTSTPTHLMRTALRPVEIRGRRIAAGDPVTVWIPAANRDPVVFAEPDRFDIRRRPNRHLALGHGEHFCLGSTLARVEISLLYRELLTRAPDIELDGPVRLLDSIVVNGPQSLPVRIRR